jgi:hypothetical protein
MTLPRIDACRNLVGLVLTFWLRSLCSSIVDLCEFIKNIIAFVLVHDIRCFLPKHIRAKREDIFY